MGEEGREGMECFWFFFLLTTYVGTEFNDIFMIIFVKVWLGFSIVVV